MKLVDLEFRSRSSSRHACPKRDRVACFVELLYHKHIIMTSDPTKCTVLYKILTPDEHAGLPTQGWTGTALDVSRLSRYHPLLFLKLATDLKISIPGKGRIHPPVYVCPGTFDFGTILQPGFLPWR